jgi:hypothetical protein
LNEDAVRRRGEHGPGAHFDPKGLAQPPRDYDSAPGSEADGSAEFGMGCA